MNTDSTIQSFVYLGYAEGTSYFPEWAKAAYESGILYFYSNDEEFAPNLYMKSNVIYPGDIISNSNGYIFIVTPQGYSICGIGQISKII